MTNRLFQILIVVLIELLFVGCQAKKQAISESKDPSTPTPPVTRSVGLTKSPLSFNSLIKSYISQAEITNQTDINNIYTIFNVQKGNLPQMGSVAEVNSAGMGAVFIVAGQVCGALKSKEVALVDAQRKVFKGFNFAPPSTALTGEQLAPRAAVEASADALSQMFLGRSATSDEKALFVRIRDQILIGETITATNGGKLASDIAVGLCTGVASSLEAISI